MAAFQQKQHLFSSSRFYLLPKPSINFFSDWVALLSSKYLFYPHVTSHEIWKLNFISWSNYIPLFIKPLKGNIAAEKTLSDGFVSHKITLKCANNLGNGVQQRDEEKKAPPSPKINKKGKNTSKTTSQCDHGRRLVPWVSPLSESSP